MTPSGISEKRTFKEAWRRARGLYRRWTDPLMPISRMPQAISGYTKYLADWVRYNALPGSETTRLADTHPCLHDRTATTSFDAHYFYQDVWAFKAIQRAHPERHVDVGSSAIYVGMLTAICRVVFIDIRPLVVDLENFECRPGSILELPFENGSVDSLSCLHVAEHVGLGRYGDRLDPKGTVSAARELARVLSPGGNLYFAVPLGRPRVCFNAHRIHSPDQVLEYFRDLHLADFAAVDDRGRFRPRIEPRELETADYACGLFHFTRPS